MSLTELKVLSLSEKYTEIILPTNHTNYHKSNFFYLPQITQIPCGVYTKLMLITILLVSIFGFSCGSLLRYAYGEGMVIL